MSSAALYATALGQKAAPLAPLGLEATDLAAWQRTALTPAREAELLEYWKHHLANAPEVLRLLTDRPPRAARIAAPRRAGCSSPTR